MLGFLSIHPSDERGDVPAQRQSGDKVKEKRMTKQQIIIAGLCSATVPGAAGAES